MSSGSRAHPRPVATSPARPTSLLIGTGALTVMLATLGVASIPASSALRFGVVAVAVGGFAALALDGAAVAWTGALAWLLVNGFLVDRFGELSWHGRADLYRALVLVAAAAVGLAAGHVVRLCWLWRRHQRFDAEWRTLAQQTNDFENFDEEETRDA
jgi:hypothetical protein